VQRFGKVSKVGLLVASESVNEICEERMKAKNNRRNLMVGGLSGLEEPLLELHAAREIGAFWKAARRLLKGVIPFRFTCFYLQPSSLTPSAVFRDGTPYRTQAEFEHFQNLNPLPSFFEVHPEIVAVRLSDVLPEAELLQSEFYRNHLAQEDDRYLACLCFRRRQSVQALIGLHRACLDRDFSEIEMQLLEMIYPHLDTALNRVLEWRREHRERCLLEGLVSQLPMATVLLDWELSVLFCNEFAKEKAAIWNHGSRCARSIGSRQCLAVPDEVYEQCRILKRQWAPCHARSQRGPSNPGVTVVCRRMPLLRVALRLIDPPPNTLCMPTFMLIFEDWRHSGHPVTPMALSAVSPLVRLSHCEKEVARLVCAGQSNREIADALGKSILTVKKQLHTIYQKLEIPNRAKLVTMLIN
jgi:DNA-binding CsgD family transcriptional regulator